MNRHALLALLMIATTALVACDNAGRTESTIAQTPAPDIPVDDNLGANFIDGLGDYHFPITTSVPEAQRWFDQGLMLAWGFNHDAAERSFLRGTEIDPDCAMCWWGASLVLGPHVNA
ncbi:MAG: hypothetical protein WBP53_09670, partial [Dokdonella sp.]